MWWSVYTVNKLRSKIRYKIQANVQIEQIATKFENFQKKNVWENRNMLETKMMGSEKELG